MVLNSNASEHGERYICKFCYAGMQPDTPALSWAPALAIRLLQVGKRSVVRKKSGKVYVYQYLRLNVKAFPEVANARRIRLIVVPPDLTAPPVALTASLLQHGVRVHAFHVDAAYRPLLERYVRAGYLGVLAVEVIESEPQETPRP